MTVYFARAGDAVKIGMAKSVASRLRSLQTGCAQPLSLIREVDGGASVERWLHGQFRHLRMVGEWFRFDPTMLTIDPPNLGLAPVFKPAPGGFREKAISKIEQYLKRTGMSERQFGISAVGDHKFLRRLRDGAGITLTNLEKVEQFMRANPNGLDQPERAVS